jgi:phenylacetaldehyde dehydrogenase
MPETLDWLSQPRPMLINGEWIKGETSKTFAVENPADGKVVAEVYEASSDDVNAAVEAAHAAFRNPEWRRMATAQRTRLLLKLADLIEENGELFAELDVLSMGKPIAEAKVWDGPLSADILRYQAGWATKIHGKSSTPALPDMRGPSAFSVPYHSYSVREPIGVCGIIIPWNAPLIMAVGKIAPALAAGCTVVLKPAEDSPLSPLKLGELIQEAGIPDGVVNIVPGFGSTTGAALVKHPKVRKLSFTGSTAVGKQIIRTASEDMKRLTLELGGKAPLLAFDDAQVDSVIQAAAGAIFTNCGQNCFTGSRLYLHQNIADQVIDGLLAAARAIKVGPGMDNTTQIGPLVNAKQRDRVAGFFSDCSGVEVLLGGKAIEGDGYFFEPSLVLEEQSGTRFSKEEVFGPVLTIGRFSNDEEAVALANDTRYGLTAGVFTNDLSRAHQVSAALEAGAVWVNGYPVPDLNLPFGGFKESGWGRENGEYGIEAYTELKSVTMALR